MGCHGGPPLLMKVEVGANHLLRMSVLQPISMQGTVTTDDGEERRTYVPDARRVFVQVSPKKGQSSVKSRMRLVTRNYRLQFDDSRTVAGRPAYVIVANPVAPDLPARRIAVDKATYAMLRYEVVGRSGEFERTMDTKSATFDKQFQVEPLSCPPGTKVVRNWGPRLVTDLNEAAAVVGFEPKIPQPLPYGMRVEAVNLLGSEQEPFIGIRLSDGLAGVTLYQWSPQRLRNRRPMRGRGALSDYRGVAYSAFGDLPREVTERLVESVVRQINGSRD